MKWTMVLALAAVLSLVSAPASAQAKPKAPRVAELQGSVIRIVDGDTFWLRTAADQPHEVVRLQGIDAPEACQAWGKDATQALARMVLNKTVTVKVAARDDYGRWIGRAFEADTDVGDRMVKDGHAWSQKDRYGRGPLVAAERMAQTLRRGLHAAGDAVEPKEFRRVNGACETATPNARPAAQAAPAPTAAPTTAPTPPVASRAASPSPAPAVAVAATSARSCDGRIHCSQMRSCEEATWFLKNCPNTKMDGNNDGVPCEMQWCR
jgi:endonuclease YncB( thermonuclease family)